MVIVAVKMSLALVALMIFELCAVGDAETARTNVPSRVPSVPLFPCSNRPRPGLCPQIRRLAVVRGEAVDDGKDTVDPPSLCGNLCTKDDVCPVGKKCCPTTCGYACSDPVILVDTV